MSLVEREYGKTPCFALLDCAADGDFIGVQGDQIARYLDPRVTGEKRELFARQSQKPVRRHGHENQCQKGWG